MMGSGILLGLAAIWFLFLSQHLWIKVVCAIYLLILVIAAGVDIIGGEEPIQWLLIFGLIAAFGFWAFNTHQRWKNWP